MKLIFNIIWLSVICMFLLTSEASKNKKNNDNDKCNIVNQADKCGLSLTIFGDEHYEYPENVQEMNQLCKKMKSWERCLKDYAGKCLHTTAQQSLSVLSYSIARVNKGYCANLKRKQAFIKLGKCMKPHRKSIAKLVLNMNTEFHSLRTYKKKHLRIPLACCSYQHTKDRAMDVLEPECTEEALTEFNSILDGYANDILNVLCGDYSGDESDKCEGIMHEMPRYNRTLEWQSFIIPMVQVISSV